MIRKIYECELPAVLDYLKKDLQMCLYIYIDIKKYGVSNPNLSIFIDTPVRDERAAPQTIRCVIMKYYRGLQMYASDPDYPAESLIEFLQTVDYNMINGSGELLDKIARTEYARQRLSCETGYVMELGNLTWEENKEITAHIQNARDDQYAQIARFICSDEELGGHYRPQDLEKQLLERKAEKFGRNKILLLDGEIVCHIATYAETDEAAVVSGLITAENSRKKGYAYQIMGNLCRELQREGKRAFLFYYIESAGKIYKRLGFGNEKTWKKLIRKG